MPTPPPTAATNPATVPAKPTEEEFNLAKQEQQIVGVPNRQCILNALLLSDKLKVGTYHTFGRVSSDGNARTFVSEVFNVTGADSFFSMTSLERASLVPYVRIFKVDRVGNSQEIPFSFTDTSIKQSGRKTANNPLGSRVGTDIGITSISIEDLTSQPEEEGSHMTVKLSIFLRNLRSIDVPFPNSTVRLADLVSRRNSADQTFDPQDNRIKMIVGWATPSRIAVTGVNTATRKGRLNRLKKACIQSRMVLELTLRDHTFSMAENGNVNLDIEYNASSDGFLKCNKVNILEALDAAAKGKVESHEKEIEKLNKEIERLKTRYDDPDVSKQTERKKELEKKKKSIIENRNKRYYDKLTEALLEAMQRVDVPSVLVGIGDNQEGTAWDKFMSGTLEKCDTINTLLGKARLRHKGSRRTNAERPDELKDAVLDKNASEGDIGKALDDLSGLAWLWDAATTAVTEAVTEAVAVTGIGGATDTEAPAPAAAEGMSKIFFFRFGDIIEVINKSMIKTLKTRHNDDDFLNQMPYIMLGPVDIARQMCVDSRGVATIGQDDRQLSIADIPVEASTFFNFFANRFVRSGARHVTYMTFINALVKELLPRALGEGENCFSKGAMPTTAYPALLPVHCKTGAIPAFGDGRPLNISTSQLRRHIIYDKNYGAKIRRGGFREVVLIYAPEVGAVDLAYRRKNLAARGIHTIVPGEARGALLGFSFSKNNQPFLPEAKVFGDGHIGQGEDISGGNVYNVGLDLMGNTFFRVGSVFFVDMIGIGGGSLASEKSLSRRLYIGGYYTVTKLKYEINLSDFITTLEGVYLPGGGAKLAQQRLEKLAAQASNNEEIMKAKSKVAEWKEASFDPTAPGHGGYSAGGAITNPSKVSKAFY